MSILVKIAQIFLDPTVWFLALCIGTLIAIIELWRRGGKGTSIENDTDEDEEDDDHYEGDSRQDGMSQ